MWIVQNRLQLSHRKMKLFQHPWIILSSKSYSWQVNHFSLYQRRVFVWYRAGFQCDDNKRPDSLHCVSLVQFRCCGVTNHTDWFEVYNASRVPDSCCLEYSDNCGLDNPGTWWTAVSAGVKVKEYLQKVLQTQKQKCEESIKEACLSALM